MAQLPAFLYKLHNGVVHSKECKDMPTYARFKKAGWVDTPAGMSQDYPLPGAERDLELALEEDDDLLLETTGGEGPASPAVEREEFEEAEPPPPKPPAPKATRAATAGSKAPAVGKLDILALSAAAAEGKLAAVSDVALLKKIKAREAANPKVPGGRKAVVSAINARIAELV